jgi:uncharacterized membrane protein YeaQ/YmgE (transglycosylase-associated protein family)
MGIVAWIILGLAAGLVATAVHAGDDERTGPIALLAIGVLGALAGGFAATAAGAGSIGSFFSFGAWAIALLGAAVLLVLYDVLALRDRGRPETGMREPPRHTAGSP